jgi:hypothetical protein
MTGLASLSAAFLVALLWAHGVDAGHELPFYPGYYPQEIRLETVSPATAASRLLKGDLHAYIAADPFAGRPAPADIRTVESLGSYLVVAFNPSSRALTSQDRRCESALRLAKGLVTGSGGFSIHPYPVTPYDPDYLEHFDLAQARQKIYEAAPRSAPADQLKVRAKGPLAEKLLGTAAKGSDNHWDAALEEVSLDTLPGLASPALWAGSAPPWLKQGWFHAYLLHAPAIADRAARQSIDALYERLVTGTYADRAEGINLKRTLVAQLIGGCERVVIGYALRRERYNAEFSQGIENIAFDSQSGLESAIFVRTAKLKDFPWNGWLRLGIASRPAAAWNPVGGFSDTAGRLLWAAIGDPALLPAPYSGDWVANRVIPGSPSTDTATVAIPEDALLPEPGTGALREVGKGKTARAKIRYRLRASAFHDNTRMTPADAAYGYAFAFRWGSKRSGAGQPYDPTVDASTALMRRALAGFKVVAVESEVKKYSDIAFTYTVPVVDVYLDAAGDPAELVALAPPWSAVPWHVLALVDEAAKRGLVALSPEEARRRGVPWLDLARDPRVRQALLSIVDGYAKEGYVPEPIRRLATADDAQTRWSALKQFVQRRGHFLVTSGPYRLDKWSDSAVVLEVFRDFTNPMGVGAFDRFAIPRRAFVSRVAIRGERIDIYPEIERVEKFLRDYRVSREPLGAPTPDEEAADVPTVRYVVTSATGAVVAAGRSAQRERDHLVVDLKGRLRPGLYTVMMAVVLDDNGVNPEVATAHYRVEASP